MIKHGQWLLAQEPNWRQLAFLLARSEQSVYQLPSADIREMSLLYRGLMNDLSRAQTDPNYDYLVPYLNNLALRCHGRVYESPPTRMGSVLDFFLTQFPRCFRKNAFYVFLAFFVFALGAVLSMVTVALDPETGRHFLDPRTITMVKSGKLWIDDMAAAPSESSFLMTHNIQVAMKAYAGGIFFGVGALALMFSNGMFALGGPLQVCYEYGMGNALLTFIMPHGVIELFTIFVAGGAGMMVGFALLFPGDLPRWTAVRVRAQESMVLVMGCFPLLVIAGMIEGMVSLDKSVDTPVRVLVAVLSVLFLTLYLGFSGREKHTQHTHTSD